MRTPNPDWNELNEHIALIEKYQSWLGKVADSILATHYSMTLNSSNVGRWNFIFGEQKSKPRWIAYFCSLRTFYNIRIEETLSRGDKGSNNNKSNVVCKHCKSLLFYCGRLRNSLFGRYPKIII